MYLIYTKKYNWSVIFMEKKIEKKYDVKLLNKFINLFNRGGLNNPLLNSVSKELAVALPLYATFIKLNVALEENDNLRKAVEKMVETATTILEGVEISTELRNKEVVKSDLEKSLTIMSTLNQKYTATVKVAGSKKKQSELMVAYIDVKNGKKAVSNNKKEINEKLNELDLISKKEWGLI